MLLLAGGEIPQFFFGGCKQCLHLVGTILFTTSAFHKPSPEAFRKQGSCRIFLSNLVYLLYLHLPEKQWVCCYDSDNSSAKCLPYCFKKGKSQLCSGTDSPCKSPRHPPRACLSSPAFSAIPWSEMYAAELAERLSSSPAGTAGGVEHHKLLVNGEFTCTLLFSSLVSPSSETRSPHRDCINFGQIYLKLLD